MLTVLLCVGTIPVPCQVGPDAASQWMTLGKSYAPKMDHGHSWGVDGTIDITSDFGLLAGNRPGIYPVRLQGRSVSVQNQSGRGDRDPELAVET